MLRLEYVTIGREFAPGKRALICYDGNENFDNVRLNGERFLLSFIREGAAIVTINYTRVLLTAPCIVCLNEQDTVRLIENNNLKAQSLYFHPRFYSWYLTFESVRKNDSEDLVQRHDCYLLMPFVNRSEGYMGVLPVNAGLQIRLKELITSAGEELEVQRDGFWSCRCRSYFTEMLIMLERIYNDYTKDHGHPSFNLSSLPTDYHDMEKVLLYLNTNYQKNIRVEDIVKELNTNRTTLSKRFKEATGFTIIEYLNRHRTQLAQSLLLHTNLKVDEISNRLGFGDNAHFSRVFSKHYGLSPQKYRDVSRESS